MLFASNFAKCAMFIPYATLKVTVSDVVDVAVTE
jgi:hypothetical protein